jgi:hypothetical protein
MKSMPLIPSILLIILFAAGPALAQHSSGEVGVSVNVVPAAAEYITLRDIDFTDLDQSMEVVEINPENSARAGKMLVTGTPNAPFSLSYLPFRLLENQSGNGILVFEYRIAGSSLDDQSTAENFTVESRELQFNDDGEYYIWIGGFVNFSNASPGSYTGDFTLEIDYI